MSILEGGQSRKLQFTYSAASHKGTSVVPPTNLNINLVDRCLSAHRRAATKPAWLLFSLCFHLSITGRVRFPSNCSGMTIGSPNQGASRCSRLVARCFL